MDNKLEENLAIARYAGKAEAYLSGLKEMIESGLISDLNTVKNYCEVNVLKLEKSYLEMRLGLLEKE